MKINNKNLFASIIAFLVIVDLLVGLDLNFLYIRTILAFLFIIIVPGLLIMLMMKIREVGFWEYLVYTVGLSVAFIMFAGLAVNWILPWLHITDKPLALWPILLSFNLFLLIMANVAYRRNKDLKFELKFPQLDALNRIFFIIPMFFPVLAVLGAFILNNNGPNTLTMIMLGGIAVYVFAVVLFHKRLNENVYPWVLFLISSSLLIMTFLRSWYISGHDILTENYVLKETLKKAFWSFNNINHPYNSCLSVTILPAIFKFFTNFLEKYWFIINQFLFTLAPIALWILTKKYSNNLLAFLASFIFLSHQVFFTDLPYAGRQEVALFFLIVFLLALFNKSKYTIITLIFGLSIIISHYSTMYLTISVLCFSYLFFLLNSKIKNRQNNWTKSKSSINGYLLLIILLFSFLWYFSLSNTSNGLTNVLSISIENIGSTIGEELHAPGASLQSQLTLAKSNVDSAKLLKEYEVSKRQEYINKTFLQLYDSDTYTNYQIRPIYPTYITNQFPNKTIKTIYNIANLIKISIKIFALIGAIYLFILLKRKKQDIEYSIMGFVFLMILIVTIVLPFITVKYDLGRVYLQAFIFLALPIVYGVLAVTKFIREEYRILILTFIILAWFIAETGALYQLSGSYDVGIALSNQGDYYERYYTHKDEVSSASWLNQTITKSSIIYTDKYAGNKIRSLDGIKITSSDVIPGSIDRRAYVYLSYTNKVKQRGFQFYNVGVLSYNYPIAFLNANKNKVYNNDGSEIFK